MQFSRVLVTGGAGFIGSHVVERLSEMDVEIGILDNMSSGSLTNVAHLLRQDRVRLLQIDIRDFDSIRKAVRGFDAVIHLAAVTSVSSSIEDPLLTNETNVTGTLNLLKASVESGVSRFIYASSSSIYGEAETLPIHEDMVPNPISPYGVSKLAGERYCLAFTEVYGLPTTCLRYFNVYGPRQKQDQYAGVIHSFVSRILEGSPPIIYGDGQQTRDFTYVSDAVKGTILALEYSEVSGGVFNIATGKPTSILNLLEMVKDIVGRTGLDAVYTSPRPGDIRHSYADIKKAKQFLGYEPTVPLREGLEKLVDWYKRQRADA